MNILIVRLGALGDLVHAVPAAAALRAAMPDARIDWLVDARHRPFLDLVIGLDRIVTLDGRSVQAWVDVVRRMRQGAYDVALDFQGLMKSAVLARASGARRVAGFSIWHLREKGARPFYSDTDDGAAEGSSSTHVIDKNLRLLRVVGVRSDEVVFPLAEVDSEARSHVGEEPFALINPGAAWPNKRWPPARLAALAEALRTRHDLRSVVLWGPGEEALAEDVVRRADGAAVMTPRTTIADVIALARGAAVMVSGDTGPTHLAAAVGTPLVGIYGPTRPERNGPLLPGDETVSRAAICECHHLRECRRGRMCLLDIEVGEVLAAAERRLVAAERPRV